MRPYYEQDGITIYHGDCREILPTLGFADIGVVVADPPYGVSMKRGDSKIQTEIHGDNEPFDPSHLVVLNLPMVLFGANNYASKLPDSTGWLIWDKTFPDCAKHSQCELAWTNYIKGIRIYREAYHGFMRQRDGWMHPTQKPHRLMQWILALPRTPVGGVLDPYMGSGPVAVAAKNLGRHYIGIEIEEKYCEIAAKRLAGVTMPLEVGA